MQIVQNSGILFKNMVQLSLATCFSGLFYVFLLRSEENPQIHKYIYLIPFFSKKTISPQ